MPRLRATSNTDDHSRGKAYGSTASRWMMPALPYDVSRPGARRSTSATACPRRASCSAVLVPIMPAPRTRTSAGIRVALLVRPAPARSAALRGDDRDFEQRARCQQAGDDRGPHRQRILEVLPVLGVESREVGLVDQMHG